MRVVVVSLFLALAVYGYLAWEAYTYRARRDEVLQLMKDVYAECVPAAKEDPHLVQRIEFTKSAIRSLKDEDSFGLSVVFDSELETKGCNPEPSKPTPLSPQKPPPTASH